MGKTGRKIGVQPRRRRRRWRLRRRCDGWLLLVAVAVVVVAVAVVAAVLTGVADFLDSFSEVGRGGLPTIRGSSAFVLVDSPRCRFWRGRNRNRNAHSCSCVGRKEAAGGTTTTTITTTTTTTTRARSTGNVSEEFESDPDDVDDDEHDTTTTTTTTAGGSPNLGVRAGTRCFCFSFSRREVLQKTSSGCVAAIDMAMAMAVATSAATATVPEECKAMVPVLARGGLLSDSGAFSPSSSPLTLPPLLESSALYQVCTASTPTSTSKFRSRSGSPPRGGPSVGRVLPTELLRDLASHRAVVLGEHHPSRADHLLQAALVEGLFRNANANANANNAEKNNTNNANKPMAVGLEAVQQAFQPALDAYCAGSIGEDELFRATEWDARWYWSFDAYLPLLRTCKGLGIPLLALDASSEDRALLEERGSGGWEALGENDDENDNDGDTAKLLLRYIPDWEGARRFGSTAAYAEYVRYTLRPIYELQQTTRTKKRRDGGNDTAEEGPPRNKPPTPTLSDFVAKQAFRDEAMASAAARWSIDHPDGLLVACVGANHASFRCGVPGRLERLLLLPGSWLSSASVSASPLPVGASPPSSMAMARRRKVCSVLLNPEPLNTGTPLEACRADGTLAPEDDDEYDARRRSRSVFVSNRANQVCIETSAGELQNYALQFEFVSSSSSSSPSSTGGERRALQLQLEAIAQGQVRSGETVLALADYLIVSPRETTTTITPA